MAAQCKGATYVRSIGVTDGTPAYDLAVAKATHSNDLRTFWGRLCSAWEERFSDKATQTAIAERYGIKQPSVGDYMRGALPRMAKVTEMAVDLRVNTEWLLTGRGSRSPSGTAPNPYFKQVFDILSEFPDEERARTLEYLLFKLQHIRTGWAATSDEAVQRALADTGRFRKPQ